MCIMIFITYRDFLSLNDNVYFQALIIQTAVRGWICRCKYLQDIRHVIIAQNAVRRFLARRKLRRLKQEARSVEHVKKLNRGLENKIISLQQRINELVSYSRNEVIFPKNIIFSYITEKS